MYLKFVTKSNNLTFMKNNIKEIRKKLRMSQEELAEALGLESASSISHYENNIRRPRLSVCYQLLDLARGKGLKIKLEDILPR